MPRAVLLPTMAETPPEPAFRFCACGALVQERAFVFGTKEVAPHWRPLGGLKSPVTGDDHHCEPLSQREE